LESCLGNLDTEQGNCLIGGLVSRTSIPDRLVHQPEEVKRNAELFDQLCWLAEEVAYPVVGKALMRETAAGAAEALAAEAKLALEELVVESALEEIDDPSVIDEVRRSMEQALPPPSEEEWGRFARDVAQMLMGNWVEILREALSNASYFVLSDQMLPLDVSVLVKQFFSRLVMRASEPFTEYGIGALALEESEARQIMKTLRHKLFSEPSLIDLPFEMVVTGAPQGPVLAMTRATFEDRVAKFNIVPQHREQPIEEPVYANAACGVPASVTRAARKAEAKLTAHLSTDGYVRLTQQSGRKDTYLYNLAGRD